MSSAEKGQAEPSMEEILASIRRIISDEKEEDGKEDAPPAEAVVTASPAPSPSSPPTPQAAPVVEPAPVEPAAAIEDDLVLTDIVDEPPLTPLAAEPVPALAPVVKDVAPAPAPAKPVAAKPVPVIPEEFDVSETVAENKKLQDTYKGLVSPPVAEKSTLTFAALADAIHARGTPLGNSTMTLEDLIRDLLRPHLKEWLDQHLPGLVEKLVRAEIERMAREAEERKDLI